MDRKERKRSREKDKDLKRALERGIARKKKYI